MITFRRLHPRQRQTIRRDWLRTLGLVSAVSLLAATTSQAVGQQPTTWWPDPASGLMWTGSMFDHSHGINFQQAQAECDGFTLAGYSSWRLPTLAEVNAVLAPTTGYRQFNARDGRLIVDYSSPSPTVKMKFVESSDWPVWTSTVAGPGRIYVRQFGLPQPTFTVSLTDKSNSFPAVFCVRPMEPDLLQLAKQAQPDKPVTGLSQLQAIALLAKAEHSFDQDQFAEAIAGAKQALALDAKSIRALDDIAIASAYAGNWADALANLNAASRLDKDQPETKADLKWVKSVQKQAAADPKALQAWTHIHDADVAQAAEAYEDAVASANQAIALEPGWPEGYDCLGLALGGVDRWPDAITALEKAVSLDKHGDTTAKADLKRARSVKGRRLTK